MTDLRMILCGATLLMGGALAIMMMPMPISAAHPLRPEGESSSRAVFERRILPILAAKNPSTCSECHLSGVDLKDYLRPSEAQTFASLRDAGLIDVKHPENSHILRFIQMSAPRSPLVNRKMRTVEYQAFRDWIMAAAGNPKLASLPLLPLARRAGPTVPVAVIRHTRTDAVVASFTRNIWSQEGRCMGCHRAGTPGNDEYAKKYGGRVSWFVGDSPEETMHRLIAQGDVDVEQPDQSLILLKPLGRVPHGGGIKMIYGDAGYKMFRAWVEDYAASVKGKYRTVRDLPVPPKDTLVNMNSVLTVNDGLSSWANRSLRVDVHPWDATRNIWAQKPVATGERLVYESNNGHANSTNLVMFLIVPVAGAQSTASQPGSGLKSGRYLLRYYCDTTGRLNQDYRIPTDAPAFYQGQQEIAAEWNNGGSPVVVRVDITAQAAKPQTTSRKSIKRQPSELLEAGDEHSV